ncbi:hypothetical protein PENSPDRAFT_751474 [Peniophora sp. CONT]|nr:hypothetical protein PENSPDRAFT_751474 [Peniophora sp. CONT]
MSLSESIPPIPIRVSNGRAFVFDVDHVATLRSKHRICGVLGGTLPHLSQQNVFLGLPLLLMPEEVVVLVDKGLAVLVDDPRAYRLPSTQELQEWDTKRAADALAQLRRSVDAQAAGRAQLANSEEAKAKRALREWKKQLLASHAARLAETGPFASDDAPAPVPVPMSEPTPAPAETDSINAALTSKDPWTVSVAGNSNEVAWYEPEHATYTSLDAAREAGIWIHPENEAERTRCAVFRDLWEKGYYMGGGSKFGGDWLVYPGDPLRYHSHFVATAHVAKDALRPMEIVAHGRLGTATKKAHLLCAWNAETGEVKYISIEWAGFG